MSINWMDFILLVLASYRVTNLLVYDSITEWIRSPFHRIVVKENDSGEQEEFIEIKGKGLQAFIGELLSCHWCTGVWASALVLLTFMYLPILIPLWIIFAISGGASLLMSIFPRG
ncbi:DUF1360 domain-containing protein [Pontibacillus yanchengensis]|uniref:DUF1360 domain-containing protein n=2 Tax=Pontibacillus yanchengensis TaxID=462910 RepID=A0ACC7VF03_9BACI|nr:DUF1360 domain-containing protein [Pontibacillus yanchengensis]MYL52786.1 DUF1360 domain-containing protein [Pontibacillus yanchengensis]